MPLPETHTPHRMVRVSDDRWTAFGALAGLRERSRVINDFIAWYVGEPGAKLPRRPKPVDSSAP